MYPHVINMKKTKYYIKLTVLYKSISQKKLKIQNVINIITQRYESHALITESQICWNIISQKHLM